MIYLQMEFKLDYKTKNNNITKIKLFEYYIPFKILYDETDKFEETDEIKKYRYKDEKLFIQDLNRIIKNKKYKITNNTVIGSGIDNYTGETAYHFISDDKIYRCVLNTRHDVYMLPPIFCYIKNNIKFSNNFPCIFTELVPIDFKYFKDQIIKNIKRTLVYLLPKTRDEIRNLYRYKSNIYNKIPSKYLNPHFTNDIQLIINMYISPKYTFYFNVHPNNCKFEEYNGYIYFKLYKRGNKHKLFADHNYINENIISNNTNQQDLNSKEIFNTTWF